MEKCPIQTLNTKKQSPFSVSKQNKQHCSNDSKISIGDCSGLTLKSGLNTALSYNPSFQNYAINKI